MSGASTPEIARFLRAHPPFDALDARAAARIAAAVELESFPAGATIFAQGAAPVAHLRVVRSGAVEIVAGGRVLDLLTEGELFGHASMLAELPPGFEARAAADDGATCYRIGIALARELLGAPEGLRYVARSLGQPPTDLHVLAREPSRNAADDPVGGLVRAPPVTCAPDATIRQAAARMSDEAANAVVVDLGDRGWGIVTDRDLRLRVVAAGLSSDAPVSAAMSAPAYTCGADRPAGEVLLEMLDRGLRHCPVLRADGRLLGVVEDMDLVAVRTRSSFYLRQRITAARSTAELAAVAGELRPMVMALHDAHVAAANVMAVYAVCVDALTRQLLALAGDRRLDGPDVAFAWLALGSQARREALPSSDVDSAVVWFGGDDRSEAAVRDALLGLAGDVVAGLRACGLRTDDHGVSAAAPAFVRSADAWRRAVAEWIADPTQEHALLLSSVVLESRPISGDDAGTSVTDAFRDAAEHPELLRMLARLAVANRPPTGFLRGLVVEHSGAHRGRLDLKRGGILPIAGLARWAALAAGVTSASTSERLRAAAAAGTLSAADAHTLQDAFAMLNDLRLTHQVQQVRAGSEPDDHLAPGELSALMRIQLREAFRAVTAVQRRVIGELDVAGR
jgi:CBS domain-containing protein